MVSILYSEIHEQPNVIAQMLDTQTQHVQDIANAIREFSPAFIMIAARGTSDNAARYAQYLFSIRVGIPVALATPSVYTLYNAQPNLSKALIIGISQSGQSDDIRQVVESAFSQGALTISITNDSQSPLAKSTHYHLDINVGIT